MSDTSRVCLYAEREAVCENYSSFERVRRNTNCNTDRCCNLCSSSPQQEKQLNERRYIYSGRWIHLQRLRTDRGTHHASYATTSRAEKNQNKTEMTGTWEMLKHWKQLCFESSKNHEKLLLARKATEKWWIYALWFCLFQRTLQTPTCNIERDIWQSLFSCRTEWILTKTWIQAQLCGKFGSSPPKNVIIAVKKSVTALVPVT